MSKFKKLTNMIFDGKEYDDMKGWQKVLGLAYFPLFAFLQIVPNKGGGTEWIIVFGTIIAVVIGICLLIVNIISTI